MKMDLIFGAKEGKSAKTNKRIEEREKRVKSHKSSH